MKPPSSLSALTDEQIIERLAVEVMGWNHPMRNPLGVERDSSRKTGRLPSFPPMSESVTPSNEELLRKVIEAQVRGGYGRFGSFINPATHETGDILHAGHFYSRDRDMVLGQELRYHILEIILDTAGAKAAWGTDLACSQCWAGTQYELVKVGSTCHGKQTIPRFSFVTHSILLAWHSFEGNNVRAALETAVSFLPHS